MKIHQRHILVNEAEADFTAMLCDWEKRHKLTFGETYRIIAMALASLARCQIHQERRVGTKNVDKFKEE